MRGDPAACFKGVAPGGRESDQGDIDVGGVQYIKGLAAVPGFACNPDIIAVRQRGAELSAGGAVAINKQDPDWLSPVV